MPISRRLSVPCIESEKNWYLLIYTVAYNIIYNNIIYNCFCLRNLEDIFVMNNSVKIINHNLLF